MSKYNSLIREDCEYLLKSAIVYLIVTWELSWFNWITALILELIHAKKPCARKCVRLYLLDLQNQQVSWAFQTAAMLVQLALQTWLVIHNNFSDRGRSDARRRFIQISDLSSCCQDRDLTRKRRIRGIRVWFRRIRLRNGEYIQGWQQVRKLPNPDTGRQWQ